MKLFILVAILACATTVRGKVCAYIRKVTGDEDGYATISIGVMREETELFRQTFDYSGPVNYGYYVFDDSGTIPTSVIIEKNKDEPTSFQSVNIGLVECSPAAGTTWETKCGDDTKVEMTLPCTSPGPQPGSTTGVCYQLRRVTTRETFYKGSLTIEGSNENGPLFTDTFTFNQYGCDEASTETTVTLQSEKLATQLDVIKKCGTLNLVSIEYAGVICTLPTGALWVTKNPYEQTMKMTCEQKTLPYQFSVPY